MYECIKKYEAKSQRLWHFFHLCLQIIAYTVNYNAHKSVWNVGSGQKPSVFRQMRQINQYYLHISFRKRRCNYVPCFMFIWGSQGHTRISYFSMILVWIAINVLIELVRKERRPTFFLKVYFQLLRWIHLNPGQHPQKWVCYQFRNRKHSVALNT